MIPFPFNENWFSFFVADHQLVGQLCTNPKSNRSLLSYLKVTQCSTSEIGDCATVQLMLSTDPSYDNRTITSTLKMQIQMVQRLRDVPRVMKTKFLAMVMVFVVVSSEGHIMPPHIFEVSLKVDTKVYPVTDTGCGSRTRRQPTSPKRPRLSFRRCATTLYPSLTAPLLPRPEPAGLLCLVICREHHQHDLPQHQSQPDRHHLPSIRRAPIGTCGNSMLPVPDPYWGLRRLHWIDVSSSI